MLLTQLRVIILLIVQANHLSREEMEELVPFKYRRLILEIQNLLVQLVLFYYVGRVDTVRSSFGCRRGRGVFLASICLNILFSVCRRLVFLFF